MSIVWAIVALGFLIVVHEWGHYIVARWCSMRVERFSIGFGPAIFGRRSKKTGTLFQIAPIPFGGFVEIRGMNIAEDVDPNDKNAYPNRPAWQRFVTIFAGPATNYVSAIVLAFALYSCHGMKSYERWWGVDQIDPGFDAVGKLQPGDRLLAIDNTPVWLRSPEGKTDRVSDLVARSNGAPVVVRYRRDGVEGEVTIKPRATFPFLAVPAKPHWRMGPKLLEQADTVEVGIFRAAGEAVIYPVKQTDVIVTGLIDIVAGDEEAEVGGPVRITEEFKKAFEEGWVHGIQLLMMLSVYIGLFNLFPLPALDGGRLVFLTYEMVTRRRANPRIESTVHMVGILLLLVVMVLVTANDCSRFF